MMWVAITVFALLEIGLAGWWVSSGETASAAALQVALVVFAALVAMTLRYLWLKREFAAASQRRAVLAERGRLAEEMPDLLGHDLSLIALQAGRLQMTAEDGVAADAARLRERAAEAVDRLHEIVDVLGIGARHELPADGGVVDVVERAQASGLRVEAQVDDLDDADPAVRMSVTGLVRESLTNAARHAAGEPVDLQVHTDGSWVTVIATNPTSTSDARSRSGNGLETLHRRVAVLGGQIEAGPCAGRWTVRASLPEHPSWHDDDQQRSRRPLASLLRDVAVPIGISVAVAWAFWTWAAHDATMSAEQFERIDIGAPQVAVEAHLPPRDAVTRLSEEPPVPAGWSCRVFTDGNVPLAQSTYRICFAEGRVAQTLDLRR